MEFTRKQLEKLTATEEFKRRTAKRSRDAQQAANRSLQHIKRGGIYEDHELVATDRLNMSSMVPKKSRAGLDDENDQLNESLSKRKPESLKQ